MIDKLSKNNQEIEELVNSEKEFRYQMLGRLQSDCKYFLGNGNGDEKHLWGKDVRTHTDAMFALYDSFKDEEVPDWITYTMIMEYKHWMLNYHKELTRPMKTSDFFLKIDSMLEYDRRKIRRVDDRCRVVRLTNDCFDIGFKVRSRFEPDGYNLYMSVVGDYGEGADVENIGLYQIDDVVPDAIKELTNLGVDFMLAAEEYLRNNRDDFCWYGYRVIYEEIPGGKNTAVLSFSEVEGTAKEQARDFRTKHKNWKGRIIVMELETRKEVASY